VRSLAGAAAALLSDHSKHLVLFDFSLSRASAESITAGTPPYLDPFLDAPGRGRYDTAAERHAAAVVLFEMATGSTPTFGDGRSDPSILGAAPNVGPEMFDPAVAEDLAGFFRSALHPDTVADSQQAARLAKTFQGEVEGFARYRQQHSTPGRR
jgi:serine/threonine protein kinase